MVLQEALMYQLEVGLTCSAARHDVITLLFATGPLSAIPIEQQAHEYSAYTCAMSLCNVHVLST